MGCSHSVHSKKQQQSKVDCKMLNEVLRKDILENIQTHLVLIFFTICHNLS